MDRELNNNEVRYLMEHLDPLYSGARLGDFLNKTSKNFLIPSSVKPFDIAQVLRIGKIPVLFPCSSRKDWYSVEGNSIRFHHDILKSAFYLLSGYEEQKNEDQDIYGRFPWKSSIQYQLGITQLPVVNYYFEVLLKAFEKFCELNKLGFSRTDRQAPILFLSHDVDRIKKYTFRNLAISFMQLLGLKDGSKGGRRQLKIVISYALGIVLFRKNPYWNFHEMTRLEQELNITSTWFFLEKTREDNSRYRFNQPHIRKLIEDLSAGGHEIAIHGTLESSSEQHAMNGGIKRLNAVCDTPVMGIRQHFLKYQQRVTPEIQSEAGLSYDSTLGFAEHQGFRNSYVHPFKLYDFERQQSMDLWQLPLNVMEATLMEYMEVPIGAIPETIKPLLEEVIRFKGVFSLLWHNCRLDEEWNPGIHDIYRKLLEKMMRSGFVSLTARELISTLKSAGVSDKNS